MRYAMHHSLTRDYCAQNRTCPLSFCVLLVLYLGKNTRLQCDGHILKLLARAVCIVRVAVSVRACRVSGEVLVENV